MKTKINLVIIILLTSCINLYSQNIKYTGVDILSNGIFGGIGTCLTKGHFDKNNFWKGFKKGCISGIVINASKQLLTTQVNKEDQILDWKIVWGSRIINEMGNSMLSNSITNQKLFSNLSFDVGFIKLNWNKNNPIQIEPISLISTIYLLSSERKFILQKSLIAGMPVFEYKWPRIITIDTLERTMTSRPKHLGQAISNNIILQRNVSSSDVFVHELIHTYQRKQFIPVNYFISKYKKISNCKFLYLDISSFDIMYGTQFLTIGYKNIYWEKEANSFALEKN